jgi:hypothetical protein
VGVAAVGPVNVATNRAVCCPVPPTAAPLALALALALDATVETGPKRAEPPVAFDAPPCVPVDPPAGGDPKFGTFAGVVGCALVSGTLTGPLPMTRAATTDTAAATALSDASAPARQSSTRRGFAAADAVQAAGTTAAAGGGGRPNSRDAKTSSKVA